MRDSTVFLVAVMAALSFIVAGPALAASSQLFGVVWVSDQAGRHQITLMAGTRAVDTTTSNDSGYYSFRDVPPGVYEVVVDGNRRCGPVRVYPQNTERNIICK